MVRRFLALFFEWKVCLTENWDMKRGEQWIRPLILTTKKYVICLMCVLFVNGNVTNYHHSENMNEVALKSLDFKY